MSNYYCLVTGLPDLSIDDGKLSYSVVDFKESIYPQLSGEDQKIIDLFYLQYDNECLLALLKDRDAEVVNSRGNYSVEELSALICSVADGEVENKKYPSYFYSFISLYLKNKELEEIVSVLPEDSLSAYYYHYAMQSKNKFVAAWFEFNLNLNNLLTAITARKYKLELSSYIVGSNGVSEAIRTSNSRDFGLMGMFDMYDQIYRISELSDLVEKERKIDILKWEWLEDASFFNYFSVEKLFVFLVKLSIIERWISLDREKGSEIFRKIIESLKNDVSIPDEFRK